MDTFGAHPTPLPERVRGKVTVSVDVEDWHQLTTRLWSGELPACSPHVEAQTDTVLDLFDAHGVRATFFVLGLVAHARPDLVKRIAKRGHEIASHGMTHVSLHKLARKAVRDELRDSRKLLSDLAGSDVVGFRAAEFSVASENLWVLDEAAAAGYRYDSSIYPIRHRRYGIAGFPRVPSKVRLASGRSIYELPIGTFPTFGGNIPIGGGGYFRLFPGALLDRALQSLSDRGEHTSLYFHPYEFSRARLALDADVLPTAPRARLRAKAWFAMQALGARRLPGRLDRILRHVRSLRAVDLVDALAERDAREATTSITQEHT